MSYHGANYYDRPGNPAQFQPLPNNYMVWAILSTIFCCFIPGIVSIVYATQVNSKYAMGNYQSALQDSRYAKNWAIAALAASLISYIGVFLFYIGTFTALLSADY